MTHREQWEEVSFQVIDDNGVMRSGYFPTGEGIVSGGVQVDRVWGNLPLQPNDDRSVSNISFGGGAGDHAWAATHKYGSDTLRTAAYDNNKSVQDLFHILPAVPADSHTIATTGYSNFPGYIPNYTGDGDAALETVVPNVRGMVRADAIAAIEAASLVANAQWINYDITHASSSAKTVTVTTDGNHELIGGDIISIYYTISGTSNTWANVKVKTVTANTLSFDLATAPSPALNASATGYIYAQPDNKRYVVSQQTAAGTIVNEGNTVNFKVLNSD